MHYVVIYYRGNDGPIIKHIRRRFRLPDAMTVNGEWPAWVADADMADLKRTEQLGFIEIRNNIQKFSNMKPSKLFIETIEAYLTKEAQEDAAFAEKMQAQPDKTPEKVCEYIMSEVSKARRSGWADDEIYGMAKHFIDEESLKVSDIKGNDVGRVVVNTRVDLSAEEKLEAMARAEEEYRQKLEAEHAKTIAAEEERARQQATRRRIAAQEKEQQAMQGYYGGLFD